MEHSNTFNPADLFGAMTEAERLAGLTSMADAESARLAAVVDAESARRLRPMCGRCGGAGFLSAFSHFKGGVCFSCGGTGERA
jgi:hypothetical protein